MKDKPRKPQKLKARLPRGLEDRGPAAIAATRAMVEKIREVYERYGFEPVETPAFEYTDALGKFLPDQDRPNEGVFSFQDDDEQWISLRYDLTAPLARYVAEHFDALPIGTGGGQGPVQVQGSPGLYRYFFVLGKAKGKVSFDRQRGSRRDGDVATHFHQPTGRKARCTPNLSARNNDVSTQDSIGNLTQGRMAR